jgi:hypothetical protein
LRSSCSSIAFSWLYLSNYFGFYGGYAGLRFLSFFGGFGSVSDLFLCIFGTRKFYYGLRLLADKYDAHRALHHAVLLHTFRPAGRESGALPTKQKVKRKNCVVEYGNKREFSLPK